MHPEGGQSSVREEPGPYRSVRSDHPNPAPARALARTAGRIWPTGATHEMVRASLRRAMTEQVEFSNGRLGND